MTTRWVKSALISSSMVSSKCFAGRAQVELVGPGRRVLARQPNESVGGRVGIDPCVPGRPKSLGALWRVKKAVDDDMRHVHAFRPAFARERLGKPAQRKFRRREGGEIGAPAQAR